MSDISTKIAALEGLRSVMGDAWVNAEIAKLNVISNPVHMQITAADSAAARHNYQIYNAPGATYYEAPSYPSSSRAEHVLNDYLSSIIGTCRTLQLGMLDPGDTRNKAVGLDHVYVGLHVEREIEEEVEVLSELSESQLHTWLRMLGRLLRRESKGGMQQVTRRRLTVIEMLMDAPERRLMLLGAPGSGKSTFVNHLLLCLAEAVLAARAGDESTCNVWIERLPSWNAGPLLPVRIILRDLAAHPLPTPKTTPLAWLHSFFRTTLGESLEEVITPLLDALSKGRAMLLFDGLDEVMDDAAIVSVVQAINTAATTYRRSPVLVTCRMRDYMENPRRQIEGFSIETLAPFDNDQVELFVEAWYTELSATGRTVLGTAPGLREAIATRNELRSLAETPLLLTMIAVVHAGRGTLPDARALLYAECIELLLLRWRQPPAQQDVLDCLNLPGFQSNDLLGLMAELGFSAHEDAQRSAMKSDAPSALALAEVERILRRTFDRYAPGNPRRRDELASILLYEIASRNGLLLKSSGEHGEAYGFPHRTFQEFLAGYYLKSRPNPVARWLERASQPHWHEALTLMIGYQVLKDEEFERPLEFVSQLLKRTPSEQVLGGELLCQMGRERTAIRYKAEVVTMQGVWGQAQRVLQRLAFTGHAPDVPFDLRVRAARALGSLCYGSITALSISPAQAPAPDARLPLAVVSPQAARSDTWRRWLHSYWCLVPAGSFWFGDDSEGTLQHLQLSYGFSIGRYPITNADFARFIAVGGYYLGQLWWTDNGRNYMPEEARNAPRYWEQPRFNNPLQPVVGVTWYEAAAYCQWLTIQGHEQGWLNRNDEIRLPTSLEWEHAARGTDQRRFPWGDDLPTPEHANYADSQIGAPTPVGCFPDSASPYGVHDMAGNMMDWLATPYGKEQQIEPEKDFTTSEDILLSFADYTERAEYLCCGTRYKNKPNHRNRMRGFRIVVSRLPIE